MSDRIVEQDIALEDVEMDQRQEQHHLNQHPIHPDSASNGSNGIVKNGSAEGGATVNIFCLNLARPLFATFFVF